MQPKANTHGNSSPSNTNTSYITKHNPFKGASTAAASGLQNHHA